MGISCNWERARFTLDEGLSKAVEEAFLRLYNDGYIYKGKRITNYCTGCNTVISDIEIEYEEEEGKLWYISYKIEGEEDNILIATTRPETMLR